MKGFKKLALVAAIAAPFSSVHALEAISDADLSGMTGQSGVTIDLETQVNIGSVTWTDTETATDALGGGIGGGSVVISGIRVGGADAGTTLDNVRINIDAGENVGLADGSTTAAGKDALSIEITSQDLGVIDLGIDVNSFGLGGNNSNIMSNFEMDMVLGPQYIVIHEDASDVGHIDMHGYFKITDMDMDVDLLGMGISNLAVGDIDWANSDLATGSYAWNQGALATRLATLKGQVAGGQAAILAGAGVADEAELAAAAGTGDAAAQQAYGQYQVLKAKDAFLDRKLAANSDNGTDLNQTAAGMAHYAVDIHTGATSDYDAAAGTGTANALVVDINDFQADIAIGDITLGGASIGSLAIDNFAVTNTSLTVYGH